LIKRLLQLIMKNHLKVLSRSGEDDLRPNASGIQCFEVLSFYLDLASAHLHRSIGELDLATTKANLPHSSLTETELAIRARFNCYMDLQAAGQAMEYNEFLSYMNSCVAASSSEGGQKSTKPKPEIEFASKLQLYPNPAAGVVNLVLDTKDKSKLVDLSVYNLLGYEVLVKHQVDLTSPIDIDALPNGIYMVLVKELSGAVHRASLVVTE